MTKVDAPNPEKFPHTDKFPHTEVAEKRRWILRYAKKNGIGAEFGVFRGHFSVVIARFLTPKKLFLVDPWTKLGERFDWGTGNYTNNNMLTTQQAKADAIQRTKPFHHIVEITEEFEKDFCERYDGKLDFVYLDSGHHYDEVKQTLILVDKILSKDGVIFGDDWYSNPEHYSGVCRAVNEFTKTHDYEIVAAGYDAQFCVRRITSYSHKKSTQGLVDKF